MAVKRKFLTSRQLRNVLLVIFGRRTGICGAISDLVDADLISCRQLRKVSEAIYLNRDRQYWTPSLGGYFFPYQQVEGDELRLALLHKVLDPKPRAKRKR